jgi:hypothetical protein
MMPGDQGKQREVRSDGGRQGTSKEGRVIDDVSRKLKTYVKAKEVDYMRRKHSSLYGALGYENEREPTPPVQKPERLVNENAVALMRKEQAWLGRSLDMLPVELPVGTSAQAEESLRAHAQMIQSIRENKEHPDYAVVQRDFRSEAIQKGKATLGAAGRSEAAKKARETQGPEGRSEAARKGHETRGPEGRSEAAKKARETQGPEGRSEAARKGRETLGAAGRSEAVRKANETRRKRQQAEQAGRDD